MSAAKTLALARAFLYKPGFKSKDRAFQEFHPMAVPKRKTSPSRRNMRRSHHALTAPAYAECPECGELKRPHHLCPSCGQYHGREVVPQETAATS